MMWILAINQPSGIYTFRGSYPIDPGFGHMTCFDQWGISKRDPCRGLISACTLGFGHWKSKEHCVVKKLV